MLQSIVNVRRFYMIAFGRPLDSPGNINRVGSSQRARRQQIQPLAPSPKPDTVNAGGGLTRM
jgi:hypothetical protein